MYTLIFCCSHLYVTTTLSLIFNQKGQYLIYTDKKTIAKLFKSLSIDGVEVYLEHLPFSDIKSLLLEPISFKRNKNKLLSYFTSYNIKEIFFFHTGYCESAHWLILKLCSSAKVYYCPVTSSFDCADKTKKRPFKIYLLDILTNYLWGFSTRRYYVGGWVPFLTNAYFERVNAKLTNIEVDQLLVNNAITNLIPAIKQYEGRIVLLQNDSVNVCVDENCYINFVNNFVEQIGIDNLVFKSHPDNVKMYGAESYCACLPNFLTADLIISSFRCYIGYGSTVLATAANHGILSISLLKLLPSTNQQTTKNLFNYMNSFSDNIKYPSTEKEFYDLISTV